ncbi:hypothetical protein TNCV_3636061 [Trichonephila clavipes]|nr:hypothetical protein TNCV_3636061 [Trichonephila clavipes]
MEVATPLYITSSLTKLEIFSKIEDTRERGSPLSTRWVDSIERDLRDLRVNRWQSIAPIIVRWRKLTDIDFWPVTGSSATEKLLLLCYYGFSINFKTYMNLR